MPLDERHESICDLYKVLFTSSGATFTVTSGPSPLGLPGVAHFSIAAAPHLLKLADGKALLSWSVRYGSLWGGGCLICYGPPDAQSAIAAALASGGARLLDYEIETEGLRIG